MATRSVRTGLNWLEPPCAKQATDADTAEQGAPPVPVAPGSGNGTPKASVAAFAAEAMATGQTGLDCFETLPEPDACNAADSGDAEATTAEQPG